MITTPDESLSQTSNNDSDFHRSRYHENLVLDYLDVFPSFLLFLCFCELAGKLAALANSVTLEVEDIYWDAEKQCQREKYKL
jgi:hypothetical protein